ncbi:MAG: hypothetical protein FJ295_17065 [Planctomycetes bacterium]|nr:hypothetical protein [Planctomycetota bacterium]
MNKPFSDELISAYLDGELTSDEQALVERTLVENVAARRMFEDLRSLRTGLQSLPQNRLDESFSERVLRAAERAMLKGVAPSDPKVDPSAVVANNGAGDLTDRLKRWQRGFWIMSTVAAGLLIMFALNFAAGRMDDAQRGRGLARADSEPASGSNAFYRSALPGAPTVDGGLESVATPENKVFAARSESTELMNRDKEFHMADSPPAGDTFAEAASPGGVLPGATSGIAADERGGAGAPERFESFTFSPRSGGMRGGARALPGGGGKTLDGAQPSEPNERQSSVPGGMGGIGGTGRGTGFGGGIQAQGGLPGVGGSRDRKAPAPAIHPRKADRNASPEAETLEFKVAPNLADGEPVPLVARELKSDGEIPQLAAEPGEYGAAKRLAELNVLQIDLPPREEVQMQLRDALVRHDLVVYALASPEFADEKAAADAEAADRGESPTPEMILVEGPRESITAALNDFVAETVLGRQRQTDSSLDKLALGAKVREANGQEEDRPENVPVVDFAAQQPEMRTWFWRFSDRSLGRDTLGVAPTFDAGADSAGGERQDPPADSLARSRASGAEGLAQHKRRLRSNQFQLVPPTELDLYAKTNEPRRRLDERIASRESAVEKRADSRVASRDDESQDRSAGLEAREGIRGDSEVLRLLIILRAVPGHPTLAAPVDPAGVRPEQPDAAKQPKP